MRILAGAVVLLFFYYAAGVVITLLLSVLLAYFLDPAVELLERLRVPRTIGALIMVLLLIGVLGAVGYGLWVRTQDFAANWPTYRDILREATGSVQGKLSGLEGGVRDLTRGHLRTFSGLLHAGWKTRSLARHAATLPRFAPHASQRNSRRFAQRLARLPDWHERGYSCCYRLQQHLLHDAGTRLSGAGRYRLGPLQHGSLHWRGARLGAWVLPGHFEI